MIFSSTHSIRIDKQLYEQLATVAQQKGYSTTEELVQHLLEQAIQSTDEKYDAQRAEQQLRGLGYLE
jgi:metal-responsive CopG/Arc/MetJ family transcriptional regulator